MPADVTNIAAAVAQAVTAQAASHGLPFLPDSLAGDVIAEVTSKLSARPVGQKRGLLASDNRLGALVTDSLGAALSKLSDPQRQALKLGLDPFNAIVIAGLAIAAGTPERHAGRRAHAGGADDDASSRNSSSRRYASLRDAEDKERCKEHNRQFTGLGTAALNDFFAIGLDRTFFDQYRLLGFGVLHIAQAARDGRALGFHGAADNHILMRAPTDLRSAAAAMANAKTPEERDAAQREYNKMIEQYQRLPDDDPRKADAHAFIIHFAKKQIADTRHDVGDRAAVTISTAATVLAAADSGDHARKMMGNEDRAAQGKSMAAAATQADDDLGVAVEANPRGRSPSARGPQAGV
jgi:hypothetical protein